MILPRQSLVTTYKYFFSPHPDHRDIIFDLAYNKLFHDNLQSSQYNASLAISVATKVTSKERLNQLLDLAYLQQRHWF